MTQPAPDPTQVPTPVEAGWTAVRAPDGTIGRVPDGEVEAAITRGFVPLNTREQVVETLKADAGPIDTAAAGAAGALNGLGANLVAPAVIAGTKAFAGQEAADDLKLGINTMREVNPLATDLGEAASFLAPTGIAGIAGRGAGRLAARGIAGEGLKAALARGAAETGIAAATEGALYGAGASLTEDMLGDHELTAEKLLANAGKNGLLGAILGLGTGAPLGAAGALAERGAGALGRGLSATGDGAEALRGAVSPKLKAAADGVPVGIEATRGAIIPSLRKGEEVFRSEATRLEQEGLGRFTSSAAKADEAAVDAAIGTGASSFDKSRAAIDDMLSSIGTPHAAAKVDSYAQRYIDGIAEPARRDAAKALYAAKQEVNSIESALDKTTREAAKAGDELLSAQQAVRKAVYGEAKAQKIVELVDLADETAIKRTLGSSFALRDDISKTIDFLDQNLQGEGRVGVARAREALGEFDKRMVGTLKQGGGNIDNARAAFVLLDKLKQSVGKSAGFGRESVSEAQAEFRKVYESLRTHLEDSSLWGRAGEAQATMNAATTGMLERSVGARRAFIDATESVGGDLVLRADPSRLKGHLAGALDAGRDLERESVERYLAGFEGQLDSASTHWPLSASEAATVEKGRAALAKFRATMASATEEAKVAATRQALIESEARQSIGGLAGVAADTVMRPMATVERLASIRKQAANVDRGMREAVDDFIAAKSTGTAPKPMPREEALSLSRRVAEVAANTSAMGDKILRALGGTGESAANAFGKGTSLLDDALGTAGPLAGRAAQSAARGVDTMLASTAAGARRGGVAFGSLASAAPKTAMALAMQTTASMAWLASKVPPELTPRTSLQPQFYTPRASDEAIASFGRAWRAVNDPVSVIRDMKHGIVSREGVEYLRTYKPKLYEQAQRLVMEQLSTAREPLPYEKRLQLGTLFAIPTDPTLEAAFIATLQAGGAAAPAPSTSVPAAGNQSGRQGRPIQSGLETFTEKLAGDT